jgi:hypothetical protein
MMEPKREIMTGPKNDNSILFFAASQIFRRLRLLGGCFRTILLWGQTYRCLASF